jgi:hypothetical protein
MFRIIVIYSYLTLILSQKPPKIPLNNFDVREKYEGRKCFNDGYSSTIYTLGPVI